MASFFSEDELMCRCGMCNSIITDQEFLEKLDKCRIEFGLPMIITSAARCESYNKKVGGSQNSYHLQNIAVDIAVHPSKMYDLVAAAMKVGIHGIGINQKKNFIHLDNRASKLVFTY